MPKTEFDLFEIPQDLVSADSFAEAIRCKTPASAYINCALVPPERVHLDRGFDYNDKKNGALAWGRGLNTDEAVCVANQAIPFVDENLRSAPLVPLFGFTFLLLGGELNSGVNMQLSELVQQMVRSFVYLYNTRLTSTGLIIQKGIRYSDDSLFTSENDHNPVVAAICATCHGAGRWREYFPGGSRGLKCTICDGMGCVDSPVKLFLNDTPPATVQANSSGWVTCSRCKKRFSTRHRDTWTGWRHHCGQRLIVQQAPALNEGE